MFHLTVTPVGNPRVYRDFVGCIREGENRTEEQSFLNSRLGASSQIIT